MREGNIQVHSENIMPIIKKWLYSDKDIFLREIVANGCDALTKFQKLVTAGEADVQGIRPRINITVEKDARTIRVEDNGIGMTEDEVEKYITQVAFSGAEEFVEKYKDKTGDDAGIIGHFGLGFYSAFMVSDTVELETLSCRPGSQPVRWVSKGESAYEIGPGGRQTRGTAVTMHIAENESEFLEESRIREMLRKYCTFMPYEIYLNPKGAEDEKPVNNTQPLWLKAPKDCTKEEYEQFYHELFLDFNPPLFWIHLNVDYPFNLKGILYFPRQQNKVEVMPGEIKLYSNQVYIADNIKEVVPEFLMLLKGAIDCPDLPLNVSRSFLQNDGDVQKISKHIAKKVSDKLHSIFTDEKENFVSYWDDISPFIKFGCIRDESFYDRVRDILLFKTIDGQVVTLSELPKQADGKVFYVSDENLQAQYIHLFKEQNIGAVILSHIIDSHFISFLEYKEKDIKFARIDSDIGDAMKNGEEKPEHGDAVAERFKSVIQEEGLTVKAERLKSPEVPAVMLLSEYARRMQDMSRLYGDAFGAASKPEITLVLNLQNPVIQALPSLSDEDAGLVCRQVYDLAKLSHKPLSAEEMSGFISRSVELLERMAKGKQEP